MPKKVDLLGHAIELPDDQAEALIRARDTDKEARRTLEARLAELEGKTRAAEDAQRKATEEAERAKLVSKGEYDKALAMEREAAGRKAAALVQRMRDRALKDAIRRTPGVLPDAADDLASQLCQSCTYDPDQDSLVVVGPDGRPATGQDGKPITVEAAIQAHVANRPWFQAPSGTRGSGAATNGTRTGIQLKRSEMSVKEKVAFAEQHGQAAFLALPE